jgi:hypothetical protein
VKTLRCNVYTNMRNLYSTWTLRTYYSVATAITNKNRAICTVAKNIATPEDAFISLLRNDSAYYELMENNVR